MPSAPAIRLEIRPSHLERVARFALIAIVAATLATAAWQAWFRALALAVYGASAWWLVRGAQRHVQRIRSIEWRADGTWRLRVGDDIDDTSVDLVSARVFGPLVSLWLRDPDDGGRRRFRIVLWPDNADHETQRRLRIRLAHRQRQSVNSPTQDAVG